MYTYVKISSHTLKIAAFYFMLFLNKILYFKKPNIGYTWPSISFFPSVGCFSYSQSLSEELLLIPQVSNFIVFFPKTFLIDLPLTTSRLFDNISSEMVPYIYMYYIYIIRIIHTYVTNYWNVFYCFEFFSYRRVLSFLAR